MARSDRTTTTEMRWLAVLVLYAAAISGAAAAARADTFSYPAFDGTTTRDLVAATNTSVLLPAALLFDHDGAFAEFNRTEGFLLLSGTPPGPRQSRSSSSTTGSRCTAGAASAASPTTPRLTMEPAAPEAASRPSWPGR
jgi:hypothetical protein